MTTMLLLTSYKLSNAGERTVCSVGFIYRIVCAANMQHK
jgi:hypothetical protein